MIRFLVLIMYIGVCDKLPKIKFLRSIVAMSSVDSCKRPRTVCAVC